VIYPVAKKKEQSCHDYLLKDTWSQLERKPIHSEKHTEDSTIAKHTTMS